MYPGAYLCSPAGHHSLLYSFLSTCLLLQNGNKLISNARDSLSPWANAEEESLHQVSLNKSIVSMSKKSIYFINLF